MIQNTDSMWVDEQRTEMPHPSTWQELNFNQLIDVKNQILDKMDIAKRMPEYLKPLKLALTRIDGLISERLSSRA